MPAFTDRLIPDADNTAWDDLGQRRVLGVVWHRMEGGLTQTDNYFRDLGPNGGGAKGLTDYGVDNTSGLIYRWNDPLGLAHPGVSANRAGWASGRVVNPYGDGLAFIDDHGGDLNVVNRDQASIEVAGDYPDPISEGCKRAVVALTAYYADQAKVPWDRFPLVNGKAYSFVRWHQEFCIGTGKTCPGPVVMDATDDLIARVAALLKTYQTGAPPVPPVYAAARPPAFDPAEWDGTDRVLNGVTWHALRRVFTATQDGVPMLQFASRKSAPTRAPLAKGEKFLGEYIVRSEGEDWVLAANGGRVPLAGLVPTVIVG
jgi:hypothetical protein